MQPGAEIEAATQEGVTDRGDRPLGVLAGNVPLPDVKGVKDAVPCPGQARPRIRDLSLADDDARSRGRDREAVEDRAGGTRSVTAAVAIRRLRMAI